MRESARIYDVRMAQFVLKIEKLSHIIGARESRDLRSPSPIMAPGQNKFPFGCVGSRDKNRNVSLTQQVMPLKHKASHLRAFYRARTQWLAAHSTNEKRQSMFRKSNGRVAIFGSIKILKTYAINSKYTGDYKFARPR